jgi:uncharacterized protein (DUF885 family)
MYMPRISFLIAILVLIAGHRFGFAAGPEDKEFGHIVDEYLDLQWKLSPLSATFNGIHTYDDQMESFSIAEASKGVEQNKQFGERMKKEIDRSKLNENNQIDYDLILQSIDAQDFALYRSHDLERDPSTYPNIVSGIGFLMFSREYAPFPERMANLRKRMEKMPQLLEEGKANLKNPPKLWTTIGIETTKGGIQLYEQLIGPGAAQLPEADRKPFEDANAKVIAALQSYQTFLEKDLLPRSNGNFADGRDNFVYRLKNFYLIDQTPEEIQATARKVLAQAQADMNALAKKTDPNKTWWDILQDGKKKHFAADQVLPEYQKCAARARQWVIDKKLATIPEEKLDVIDTPTFMRFVIPYAAYFSPAPFEKEQKGFYFVTPVNTELSKEQQDGQLGELFIDIENTTVHEAYPGHHLQFIDQNQLSKIRRVYSSSLMSEGWGLYCERLAEEFKFYSTPVDSLEAYRWLAVRAVRVIVDVGLQTQGMSFDEAVNFMIENTKLEKPAAEGEVRRYTQSPTQPLSYLMGMLMIYDLRSDYQKAMGDKYTIQEFHDELLSYGSIPLEMIRTSMLAKTKK